MARLMSDMGILRVEVIGAKNLMAGDRSGKSDVSLPLLLSVIDEELMSSLMSALTSMELGCSNRRRRRSKSPYFPLPSSLTLTPRTLSPTWNENFEAMIPSRVSAKFNFEVQDWNTVGSSTDLGGGQIDLASLEPFESQELTIPIVHPEKGEKGHLDVRLLFQPESESIFPLSH
jgi:Ca2+-dependent lipid-binding protein